MILHCKRNYETHYKGTIKKGFTVKVTHLNENISRIDTECGKFMGTILNAEIPIYFNSKEGMF